MNKIPTKTIPVKAELPLYIEILQQASANGMSISEFVYYILIHELKNYKQIKNK